MGQDIPVLLSLKMDCMPTNFAKAIWTDFSGLFQQTRLHWWTRLHRTDMESQ